MSESDKLNIVLEKHGFRTYSNLTSSGICKKDKTRVQIKDLIPLVKDFTPNNVEYLNLYNHLDFQTP